MLIFSRFYSFKNKKNMLKSQKGMALLSVIIFTFVLLSVGIAMLTMAQNDTKRSTLQRDSTKAFYLAESGIEETFWKLNNPEDNDGLTIINHPNDTDRIIIFGNNWEEPYHYPSGNYIEYYEVTISTVPADDPDRDDTVDEMKDWVYIDSTGVVKGNEVDVSGKRTVRVKAHLTITQNTSVLYDKAILTDQLITFQGNPGSFIEGDVHSNHSIEVKGPYTHDGIATTAGVPEDWPDTSYSDLNDLDDTDNGDFSGPDNWPTIPMPEVPYDEFLPMAESEPSSSSPIGIDSNYFPNGFDSKDYPLDEFEFTGIVYVVGDVIFRNADSLHITDGALIVVKNDPDDPHDSTGTVEFKNGSYLTIDRTPEDELPDPLPDNYYPGPIALAAQSDILLHASSSSLNGVVQSGGYYNDDGELLPGGMVDFRNSSVVTGSVVAEEVWMHNKTTINYDGDFMDDFTVTTTGDSLYRKTSWQEIYI